MSSHFKVSPSHLLPIIISVAATSLFSSLIYSLRIEVEPITFFPETTVGATLNMSVFMVLLVSVAVLIYLLIKRGFHKFVKHLIKGAVITALFVILEWFRSTFMRDALFNWVRPENILFSIGFTIILSAAFFKGGVKTRVVAASLVGALIGTFLGSTIPLFTSIILLVILCIYDVVSVYRGPIGKIVEKAPLENFMGAVVTYDKLTIGMGDLVFYSMLVATVRINLGVLPYVAALVGIFTGAYGSLKILEKKELFPGLPLSILLGLILSIVVATLS